MASSLTCGAMKALAVTGLMALLAPQAVAQETPRPFEGVLYAIEERDLALPVAGLIATVTTREGMHVEQGEALLQLDTAAAELEMQRRLQVWEDETAIVASSERLRILDNQYQILRTLLNTTGSVSQDELDALQLERLQTRGQRDSSQVQKALAELEYQLAVEALDALTLKAPIDGVITHIEKFDGEWVSAGDTVATLVDLSAVVLRISIPDALARRLETGSPVPVAIEGIGPHEGVVTSISPVADQASGLVGIDIEVPNLTGNIRPGSRATAQL
ncbi:efflux RND transporter periplasmic adaptor subunit [Vreelandella andesensis]|uniref:Efflux RND transporter periplasmic adaptor subunit n=1 Tax=Vreelandella andesensis TaxID=447567 RepID=A0A433KQK5_9GAMM|nr:efflux RND transporter periplasmic adaptor subunit [Halomonas andesensis]RUR31858.1 efflux RND transporter periplasmic adaptor subunit [Halomonas andesensis]